ncbi:hypothetical protein [Nonomuraea sp. NPDC049309]|jgi:hypothetical protein|uniref:hypothetical protein n=1 Tax=Nonomuraea sp. NPDC049309 TaxID=3364350 RepID=UPI00371CEE6B
MSGYDHPLDPPRPVRLARLCLWVQALFFLPSVALLIMVLRAGAGDDTLQVVVQLAVQVAAVLALGTLTFMVTTRRTWVRLTAVCLQALLALTFLLSMFGEGGFFLGALAMLVASVGATQLLTEPAQEWFNVRGRRRSPTG